jgi:hypothetical protein
MKSLTGGALLLVLGVPLALYSALAVKAVARADLLGGDPPADRGASKDQLAALRAKAANWLGEVRKATTVAGQYRVAKVPDDDSSEPAVKAAVRAASARAKDLIDVDRFLSNTVGGKFEGNLAGVFGTWYAAQAKSGADEAAVVKWLELPPPVASALAATDAMNRVRDLIEPYAGSQFADRAKVATWRVRARLHVVTELEKAAEEQYGKTVRAKLPLAESASEATKATLVALGEHTKGLQTDLEQARTDGADLAAPLLKQAEAKKALSDETAARKALLDLLAEEKLFAKPGGAAEWLNRVGEAYRKSDARTRALIRDKVQEFCEAFVAPAAQLDEFVLLEDKRIAREAVRVVYVPRPGAKEVYENLSLDADGLNEHTVFGKPYSADAYLVHGTGTMSRTLDLKKLKPTELSLAAVAYNKARRAVAEAPGRAKWTPNSLADLKKACGDSEKLVDQLKVPGGAVPQLWVRLTGLADGATANRDLFGDQ